jgi:UDP-N-acetyl-2-amino-2-deoxyglucuronate dehydrogenase
MRLGSDSICEKPVVINPWNIEALEAIEQESGRRVHCILQLRLHPTIIALRDEVARRRQEKPTYRHQVRLDYVTSRGPWYHQSWKGDEAKSGGIVTNIGIHFFDMLLWVFGGVEETIDNQITPSRASGRLLLETADVDWSLSIEAADLPAKAAAKGQRTYRAISVDGQELEFSGGFTDLHTQSYAKVLAGEGFGLRDALPSIALVHQIRDEARGR